jgi:hypothetical protein
MIGKRALLYMIITFWGTGEFTNIKCTMNYSFTTIEITWFKLALRRKLIAQFPTIIPVKKLDTESDNGSRISFCTFDICGGISSVSKKSDTG